MAQVFNQGELAEGRFRSDWDTPRIQGPLGNRGHYWNVGFVDVRKFETRKKSRHFGKFETWKRCGNLYLVFFMQCALFGVFLAYICTRVGRRSF